VTTVVVGGGIFGQVIAWRLALRGERVRLVEPVAPGHAGSQSGDRSRIVRALYGERRFAEAGHASLALWDAWGRELGVPLVDRLGVLYLERDADTEGDRAFAQFISDGRRHLAALGAEAIELTPSEVVARHPAINPRGLVRGVFEPAAGLGRAALATRTIARAALATGNVEPIRGEATRVLMRSGRAVGVEICATKNTLLVEGDRVVLAAGLAGARLVEALTGHELGVRPIPHFAAYWDVPLPGAALLAREHLPVWAELGAGLYGFPDDGEAGFKVAWHEPLRSGDARAEPTSDELEALRRAAAVRFPALAEATLRGTFRCTYDATSDERFLVGPVPEVGGLTLVAGLSGHGYKHAPAVGEAVALALLGQAAEAPIDLAPHAFAIEPGPPA
jgi:sarcosine oxidase